MTKYNIYGMDFEREEVFVYDDGSLSVSFYDGECEPEEGSKTRYNGSRAFKCSKCGAEWQRDEFSAGDVIRGNRCQCGNF